MAKLENPVARRTAEAVVAPTLRVITDNQATLVATGSAEPQTASLYRDVIVPPQAAAIERGRQLSMRYLDDNATAVGTVETTAEDFLEVTWKSQKQAIDETGEVHPKTSC